MDAAQTIPAAADVVAMSLVDLGKQLLEAAKTGNTDHVRMLMHDGAPFTTDWLGTSPLHFAAQFGHIETAEVLLRAGISRDARTKVDRTPLHVASQEGHIDIVELLIQNQADVEAKDMLKMTPLHWAVEMGYTPTVELLIKHGADVNCQNKFDHTPLNIALSRGRHEIGEIIQLAQSYQPHTLHDPCSTVTIETAEEVAEAVESVEVMTEEIPVQQMRRAILTKVATNPILMKKNTVRMNAYRMSGLEQDSTSVLSTLAALAEATAQIGSPTKDSGNSDAYSFLESHGITMISTNDGNILASAVESGQTLALTEAGKLAINLIKQESPAAGVKEKGAGESRGISNTHSKQKVITIVRDRHAIARDEDDDTDTPLLLDVSDSDELVRQARGDADMHIGPPAVKRLRTLTPNTSGKVKVLNISNLLQPNIGSEDLRKQLEEAQRQAQQYKQQLQEKQLEADTYKKRLNEIQVVTAEDIITDPVEEEDVEIEVEPIVDIDVAVDVEIDDNVDVL